MKDTLYRHQAENLPGILLEHSWKESKKKKKKAPTEGGVDGKVREEGKAHRRDGIGKWLYGEKSKWKSPNIKQKYMQRRLKNGGKRARQ